MTSEVQIERIEHFIGSSDGTSQLRVLLWIPYLPENELKGIVQIVHGMEEHIDRYDEFARFLARNGFVVGAHDHVGHGKSVSDVRDLGHITLDQGDAVLVNVFVGRCSSSSAICHISSSGIPWEASSHVST